MGKYVGIWISHGIAKIVSLSADGHATLTTLESNIEKRHKSTSGTPSKTLYSHGGVTVTKYTDMVTHQLNTFYASVLAKIATADKFFLLGPGLAKKELKNEINQRKDLAHKVIAVESCDKITDPQLVAKVKSRFGFKR